MLYKALEYSNSVYILHFHRPFEGTNIMYCIRKMYIIQIT